MDKAENTHEESETLETAAAMTSGERLKAARVGRDLSLKDVAASTHQSLDTLAALETMETDHISPTILRMQASMYASFLGLPADEIASDFSAQRSVPDSTNMPGEIMRNNQMQTRRRLWPIGLAAAVIVVAGVVFWSMQSSKRKSADTPVANKIVVPPVASPSSGKSLRAVSGPELSIRAKTAAWIEVRGSDGTIFRNRTMSAGEVYYPRMDAAWTVTVRDAGAFEWWLGEHFIEAVGAEGVPVYSVSIDEAKTRGLAQISKALAETDSSNRQPR